MFELGVRVAQRLGRASERFQQRLQGGQTARVCVGARFAEPRGDVHDQKVSVPRTLIGIVMKRCGTGSVKRFTATLTETSTPIGPTANPPPASAK